MDRMHDAFNEINIWLAPNEHQYSISMLIVRMIEISIPHLLKLNFLQQMCVSFSHVQCLSTDVLFLHLHESSCPHDGSQARPQPPAWFLIVARVVIQLQDHLISMSMLEQPLTSRGL